MSPIRSKSIIKGVLAAIIMVTVIGMGGVFYLLRTASAPPQQVLSLIPEDTDVALDNIAHTATSDGRTQWRLTAEKARLTDSKRRLLLTRPSVVFFLEDGKKITLTADRGELETKTNDIAVNGNVVVNNRDYRMVTESLRYAHADRMLVTDQPVAIDSRWAALTALAMRVDIDTGTAAFSGEVKGWLARDLP